MDGEADDVPLNSLAAVVDPATDVVTESDVAVTIAPPTTNRAVSFKAEVVTPVGVPMSTGLPPRFEFSDKFEHHERKFVLVTCGVCLILMAGCVIASAAAPTTFGEFYPAIATNFAIIFLAEVVWRALLSCVAYRHASRYKRTINYTRKLGNCFKLYKLFVFGKPKPSLSPLALNRLLGLALALALARPRPRPRASPHSHPNLIFTLSPSTPPHPITRRFPPKYAKRSADPPLHIRPRPAALHHHVLPLREAQGESPWLDLPFPVPSAGPAGR